MVTFGLVPQAKGCPCGLRGYPPSAERAAREVQGPLPGADGSLLPCALSITVGGPRSSELETGLLAEG